MHKNGPTELVNFVVAALFAGGAGFGLIVMRRGTLSIIVIVALVILALLSFRRGIVVRAQRKSITR